MPDYRKMYYELFHAIEDAIQILIQAQRRCEEIDESEDAPLLLLTDQRKDRERPRSFLQFNRFFFVSPVCTPHPHLPWY